MQAIRSNWQSKSDFRFLRMSSYFLNKEKNYIFIFINLSLNISIPSGHAWRQGTAERDSRDFVNDFSMSDARNAHYDSECGVDDTRYQVVI